MFQPMRYRYPDLFFFVLKQPFNQQHFALGGTVGQHFGRRQPHDLIQISQMRIDKRQQTSRFQVRDRFIGIEGQRTQRQQSRRPHIGGGVLARIKQDPHDGVHQRGRHRQRRQALARGHPSFFTAFGLAPGIAQQVQ
jgi:hypothetical protein